MKNILIDFTYYQAGSSFHGGGEYGNVILEELLKEPVQTNCGIFFLKGKRVNKKLIEGCIDKGWNIHSGCDVRNVSGIVRQYKYTTIYSALPYANSWGKVRLPSNIKFIGTFHGLRNLELANCEDSETEFFNGNHENNNSDYIYETNNKKKKMKWYQIYENNLLAFKNGKIIVVSEHTKHSIYYYFPALRNADIEVLYSPPKLIYSKVLQNTDEILKGYGLLFRNFGLIVSADIWYKNALRAVYAYDRIFDNKYDFVTDDYKVVVTGISNKNLLLSQIKNKSRFLLLDYVSTETLETFYSGAQLFVYPSLNEGFGYPPLEAMKYGTLCACSANTSITEICKDMVLYFNPLLIEEIAIRILESFSEEICEEKKKIMRRELPIVEQRQKRDLQRLIEIITEEEKLDGCSE